VLYRKGISRSAKPYRRSAPSWLKATAPNVTDQITKMAKKGMTPSQIGVMLRDSSGIAQVKSVTGSKILRILKSQGECDVTFPCPVVVWHARVRVCGVARRSCVQQE
jgi:hypothetical protein